MKYLCLSMNKLDTDTIQALRGGDTKAFEKVFFLYFNKIKEFINGYIKSDIDAEELAQDIFVNMWINHEKIDTAKSFHSYLHTIAYNTALNYLKHKLVKETYQNNTSPDDKSYTSEDDLIAKETQLLIDMAVDRMPEQRRQIYRLSRNEGLKNDEIAKQLNITKSNVESQISLALKDLRKVISTVFLFLP